MVTHFLAIATMFSLLFSGGASGCRTKDGAKSQSNKSQTSQNEKENQPDQKASPSASEFKVVAEGFHSSVTKPFIAVIRDGATFSELAKLEPTLRNLETDFKTNILIAVFLGERNTGGYNAEISPSQTGKILIREKKPGKDVMVPQVITSPFKVVSVQSSTALPVRIEFDAALSAGMDNYTVIKGTFTVSGGFAGRREEFELVGGVRLMQQKQLVSFGFILRKKAESNKIVLEDFATGTVESGAIKVAVLSAGDLIPPPTNGLGASGNITNYKRNLSLTFISLPTMIADGYGGGGMIEAVKVIPTAEKRPLP